ncbi:MAG TPA: ribonuclease E/G [Clostridiales bacterium]|nr:ribonuclease E/G [Clostridiales bacterium]
MSDTLFIGKHENELRIALYENDRIAELYIDRKNESGIMGNVYRGKVQSYLPGMQAAFIDIGTDKNAYLYTGENSTVVKRTLFGEQTAGSLKPGDKITVQVLKETPGNKGPRVTTNITFAGMYVICIPGSQGAYVSKKITDAEEKDRLNRLAYQLKPEGFGLIIRTEAEDVEEELIRNDLDFIMQKIKGIVKKEAEGSVPALIYDGADAVEFAVRELLKQSTEKVITDDPDVYRTVEELLSWVSPDMKALLKYAGVEESAFWHDKIDACLVKIGARKVWLKCGGYVVIDKTEALTAIDVNTGKNVGNKQLRDTIMETNLQAATEIARQLRLRDIGGIIIIDFIDMKQDKDKRALLDALRKVLREDKMRTVVVGITKLNLVEMTRKRRRPDMNSLEK